MRQRTESTGSNRKIHARRRVGPLDLIQVAARLFEVRAGIHHRLAEPQRVEIVRDVLVERDRLCSRSSNGPDGATLQRRARVGRCARAAVRQAQPKRCDQGPDPLAPGHAGACRWSLSPSAVNKSPSTSTSSRKYAAASRSRSRPSAIAPTAPRWSSVPSHSRSGTCHRARGTSAAGQRVRLSGATASASARPQCGGC